MTGLQYFTHRCGLQDAANKTCMFHLLAFPGSVVALHGDRAATPHTGSWNRRWRSSVCDFKSDPVGWTSSVGTAQLLAPRLATLPPLRVGLGYHQMHRFEEI